MIDSSSTSALSAFSTGINTLANNLYNPTSSTSQSTSISQDQNMQVQAKVQMQEEAADYAKEMTDLINYENGYQANVQTIQTADQVLGTVLDMKV